MQFRIRRREDYINILVYGARRVGRSWDYKTLMEWAATMQWMINSWP